MSVFEVIEFLYFFLIAWIFYCQGRTNEEEPVRTTPPSARCFIRYALTCMPYQQGADDEEKDGDEESLQNINKRLTWLIWMHLEGRADVETLFTP